MRTIRGRLATWYAVALGATMLVFAIAIYAVQRRQNFAELDAQASLESELIAAILGVADRGPGSLAVVDPETGRPRAGRRRCHHPRGHLGLRHRGRRGGGSALPLRRRAGAALCIIDPPVGPDPRGLHGLGGRDDRSRSAGGRDAVFRPVDLRLRSRGGAGAVRRLHCGPGPWTAAAPIGDDCDRPAHHSVIDADRLFFGRADAPAAAERCGRGRSDHRRPEPAPAPRRVQDGATS